LQGDIDRLLQKHQGDVQASIQDVALGNASVQQSLGQLFRDPAWQNLHASDLRESGDGRTPSPSERYRKVGEAKRGGIGQVWRAKDTHLGRVVALKELRPDRMLSAQLRARFLAEAQINAQLTHPNIVPAFELVEQAGGAGPFYTMQYVEGPTLSDAIRDFHARRKEGKAGNLELRQLLTAFVAVCKAVDYAHDRGVIHRDLKGQNVILGQKHGEVFLLDWGMAKVISGQPASERVDPVLLATMALDSETQAGDKLGTPAYMAPEQAAGKIELIDRRTDVYALGVILYEMLTCRLPFVAEDTPSLFADLPADGDERNAELQRRRIARLLERIIQEPAGAPRQVDSGVPVAMEKVCLKALAKDRAERYAGASELAQEIERWLADEPVAAYRESWLVRSGRWLRKHRPLVAGLAASAAVALISLSVMFAVVAVKHRELKIAYQREAARLEQIEKGTDILGSIFAELDPRAEEKEGKPLREILGQRVEQAAEQLEGEAIADALTVAKLQTILGQSLSGLGHFGAAVTLLEKSAATRTATLGDDHSDTLVSRNNLANAYSHAGQLDLAIQLYQRNLKASEAKLADDHPDTLTYRTNLARAYRDAGQLDLAIPLLQRTLKASEAKLGDNHPNTLKTRDSLALAYEDADKLDLAIPLLQRTLKVFEANQGDDHHDTLSSRNNLAHAYEHAGRLDLAIPLLQRNVKVCEAKLGDDHHDTLSSRNSLGSAYRAAGKLDLAIPLLQRTLKACEAKLGDDHHDTLTYRNNLAAAYQAAGKLDLAIPLYERTLKACEAKLGDDHPNTLACRNNLASAYQAAGKLDLAIPLLQCTLKVIEAKQGDAHRDTLSCRDNLASAYQAAGKLDLAIPLFERNIKALQARLGDDHPYVLISRDKLASAYQVAGELDLAIPLHQRTLRAREANQGEDHPDTLISRNNLASAYQAAGKLDLALPLLQKVVRQAQKKWGFAQPLTLHITDNWIAALEADHQYGPAIQAGRELVAVQRKEVGKDDPRLAFALVTLGRTLLAAKHDRDAEAVLRESLTIPTQKVPDTWGTFYTQSLLGAALLGQKKYANAEPLLLRGFEGMKQREAKILPQDKIRLTNALERLVQLYEATGKKDEAAKWRKDLDAAKAVSKPRKGLDKTNTK
jgi:serine/threonine protein kinase